MATVDQAEGFAELGLFQDAWDALEALPAEGRGLPAALRVRLACCPTLKAWNAGIHIADFLKDGNEPDRKAAAKFFLELALKWVGEGDAYAAREAIKAAAKSWPDCRATILDDPILSEML
jgi:lipopolysaccharide biosynthesis regulator YciM